MRKASLRIVTDEAVKLKEVLEPEGRRPLPRARVDLRLEDEAVLLELTAEDTSALRASLNSYIRWASTALGMMEEARG